MNELAIFICVIYDEDSEELLAFVQMKGATKGTDILEAMKVKLARCRLSLINFSRLATVGPQLWLEQNLGWWD